jgi:hypothetical protein
MTRQQYMLMKMALEQEFKRHLATKNLEAAAIVAQILRAKCPEVRRHA